VLTAIRHAGALAPLEKIIVMTLIDSFVRTMELTEIKEQLLALERNGS
jgi:hypothetical protein